MDNNPAEAVRRAIEMGYRMIDTSGDYGTQPAVGQGFRDSGMDRGQVYIVTKVEENEDAYLSTKSDLDELGLDYADLMLIHRPPPHGAGAGLWKGLIRAKREGLTKDIGVSNYSIEQMQELADETGEMPVVNQIEWSPFGHSEEMLDFCEENGIIIQAYSPLTRGKKLGNDTLEDLADKYERSVPQIIIRWNLQLGTVPIIKANSVEHMRENLNVFDFVLNPDDMELLDKLNKEYSSLGSLPYV
jgi:diketogulonate reductase-like aldo/keto reductase